MGTTMNRARSSDPRGKETSTGQRKGAPSSQTGRAKQSERTGELREAVWQLVSQIPKGRIATYGQIARLAGYPSHARYVGRTLANLPDGSKLPWHRVLGADRTVSIRDGGGHVEQRRRLEREGVAFVGRRVPKGFLWEA